MGQTMPNVIDLYAGAGGLSLGAFRAGFTVVAAIEIDKHAMETHKRNFPQTKHIARDIRGVFIEDIEEATGINRTNIAGVIGGPPCQGFSSIGHGNVDDERNLLFKRFFEIVRDVHPLFFVAENVPGIIREKYTGIREAAFNLVNSDYVILEPILVDASEYGAATSRTRYFFVGLRKDSGISLSTEDFERAKVPKANRTVVSQALEGLPLGLQFSKEQTGVGTIDKSFSDRRRKHLQNRFFYSRATDCIPKGVGNPNFIKRYKRNHETNGFLMTDHTKTVVERYQKLEYGEQDKISKSYKLNPASFCPTLRAGTGPDKGSFQAVRPIHYIEARVINPREAARLQGFPDWFELPETIWHSFRQIGNSVSPIAAEAFLKVIYDHLSSISTMPSDETESCG